MSQKIVLSETSLLVAKVLNFCALPFAEKLGHMSCSHWIAIYSRKRLILQRETKISRATQKYQKFVSTPKTQVSVQQRLAFDKLTNLCQHSY